MNIAGLKDDSNFNSIKVQLEQEETTYEKAFNVTFQFHKGTIRTSLASKQIKHFIISIP